jgi:hypothetical protein
MRGRAVAMRRCVLCVRAMDEPLREGWAGDSVSSETS